MKSHSRFLMTIVAACAALAAPAAAPAQEGLRTIPVPSGDVVALEAAVGDPANANTNVLLAPGEYILRKTLALQENQFLTGSNRYVFRKGVPVARDAAKTVFADPSRETVLDLRNLPVNAVGVSIWRGGIVGLTIRKNGDGAAALVNVGVPAIGEDHEALVSRCDLSGGTRGVRVQHNSLGHAGIETNVRIEQSILRDQSGFFGFGFQLQISATAIGARIRGVVTKNLLLRTRFGGFVAGLADGVTFDVASSENVYERNGAGLALHAARDARAATGIASDGAVDNSLTFTSDSDAFVENGAADGSFWPHLGGITAITAFRTAPDVGPHSNNTLRLAVRNAEFRDNLSADVVAYAALSLDGQFPQGAPGAAPAGENNTLDLSLDVPRGGVFFYCDGIPAVPGDSNQVVTGPGSDPPVENCSPL